LYEIRETLGLFFMQLLQLGKGGMFCNGCSSVFEMLLCMCISIAATVVCMLLHVVCTRTVMLAVMTVRFQGQFLNSSCPISAWIQIRMHNVIIIRNVINVSVEFVLFSCLKEKNNLPNKEYIRFFKVQCKVINLITSVV
jgi:hypothetical protein